jgi:hypothetical protein
MPEELLLELETAPPVVESLEKIEELMLVHVRDVVRAVEAMKGSANTFENAWRQIILNVAKGQTAEMQALRPRLSNAFEKRLNLLNLYRALITLLRERGRTDIPGPDVLSPEIAGMERLKSRLFQCWQSAEDLEGLAARDYPLTTADLDQIGPQRRPPDSWYAEESKPF